MRYFSQLATVDFSACFANERAGIKTVQGGWFLTGDRVTRHDDGYGVTNIVAPCPTAGLEALSTLVELPCRSAITM